MSRGYGLDNILGTMQMGFYISSVIDALLRYISYCYCSFFYRINFFFLQSSLGQSKDVVVMILIIATTILDIAPSSLNS